MEEISKYSKGSEWKRWDLHIHTPGTLKNDQFEGKNIDEKWTKFIQDINNYPSDEIIALAITDYISIENYFKFKGAVKSGEVKKNIKFILSNIEFRLVPITANEKPINIHCIFNPEIENEIENRFLGKIKFSLGNSSYSATKQELIRFGRDIKGNKSIDEKEALLQGVGQYVIGFDAIKKVFDEDIDLRNNVVIVVSNSDKDGVSGITQHSEYLTGDKTSQLDTTRKSIYKFCEK